MSVAKSKLSDGHGSWNRWLAGSDSSAKLEALRSDLT
jgi:hypothetical protein